MWQRADVMEVYRKFNHESAAEAEKLLYPHPTGNTIATEGCLITCLAMVLRLLAPRGGRWTPRTLNAEAKASLFYTESGLSMVPLYADLVADVTNGEVQLCAQEQYLSGEPGWPRTFPSGCTILRGYRALPSRKRRDFVIMLKTGTHDDTVASHYVLVDPDDPGAGNNDDMSLLDPIQPNRLPGTRWRLSQSCACLLTDRAIRRAWRRAKIVPCQISGAWAFARWREASQDSLALKLFQAIIEHGSVSREMPATRRRARSH